MMTERDSKILALYSEGRLIKDIAIAAGLAPNTIGNILRRNGVERPTKPQKMPRGAEKIDDRAVALWRQGLCVTQIAERMACSVAKVANILSSRHLLDKSARRNRYDGAAVGGSGRSGFAASFAKRT